jgi:hypothetical protein
MDNYTFTYSYYGRDKEASFRANNDAYHGVFLGDKKLRCTWMSSSHLLLSWLAANWLYMRDESDSSGMAETAVRQLSKYGFVSLRRRPCSEFVSEYTRLTGNSIKDHLVYSCMDLRHLRPVDTLVTIIFTYRMDKEKGWNTFDQTYLHSFLDTSFIPFFSNLLAAADLIACIHMTAGVQMDLITPLWEILFSSCQFRLFPAHLLSLGFVVWNLDKSVTCHETGSRYRRWRSRFTKGALTLLSPWIRTTGLRVSYEFKDEYERVMREVDGITGWIKLSYEGLRIGDAIPFRKAMTFMLLSGDEGHMLIYRDALDVLSRCSQPEYETMTHNHDVILRMMLSDKPVRSGYDDIDRMFNSLDSCGEEAAWLKVLSCRYCGPPEYEVALNGLVEYRR